MSGICFYMKDGTKDWYDPVADFREDGEAFIFFVFAFEYMVEKSMVDHFEWYEPKETDE
jgi:hypothetical protein